MQTEPLYLHEPTEAGKAKENYNEVKHVKLESDEH